MTPPTAAAPPAAPPRPGARSAVELHRLADLGESAQTLLRGEPGPRSYLARLLEAELFAEAVRFLAFALPKREGVWWAWVCARKAAGGEPNPPVKAALEATERWIVQPSEEHRRQAMREAQAADFGTAAGCAALAAFLTSGSIAPPDAPVTPPGEFMTAQAVAGAVTLAAVTVDPEHAPDHFREYLQLGLEVAERTKLWDA